jgi:hypothetical protein
MTLAEPLIGLWLFTSVFYQGHELPPPNPTLHIQYEFADTGVNTLRYYREGENGFCERRALYEYASENLLQEVVWVNPENASWCDQDSDMRLGQRTRNRAWIEDGRFKLEMNLGEETITYIWIRK